MIKKILALLFTIAALGLFAQNADWKQQSAQKVAQYVTEKLQEDGWGFLKVSAYEKTDGYEIDANLVYIIEFKGKVMALRDYYKRNTPTAHKILNVSMEEPKKAVTLTIGIAGRGSSTGETQAAEVAALYYEGEETAFSGKATVRKSDNGSRIEKIEITKFAPPTGVMPFERAQRLQQEQVQKLERERVEKERYDKEQAELKKKQEAERNEKIQRIKELITADKTQWKCREKSELYLFMKKGTVMIWEGDRILPITLKWYLNGTELQITDGSKSFFYEVDIDVASSALILSRDGEIRRLVEN